MLAFSVLRHALHQILLQPLEVLRIFLLPTVLTGLLLHLTGLGFTLTPIYLQVAITRGVMPWGTYAAVIAVSFLLFAWMAAAWHRFILLSHHPRGVLPSVPWPVYRAFLLKSLWIGFLIFLTILVASFILGLVLGFVAAIADRPPGTFTQLVAVALALPVFAIGLRLAVALPGAAVGAGEVLASAWAATSGRFWTFVVLMVLLTLVRLGAGQVMVALELTSLTMPGLILSVLLETSQAILSLSIITTLYGHLVEGRPLV